MNSLIVILMQPLVKYLSMDDLMEISIVESGWVCLEKRGEGYIRLQDDGLNYAFWIRLCYALANINNMEFDVVTQPKLSTVLPGGHRIEALLGSYVDSKISISIRVNNKLNIGLDDFGLRPYQINKLILSMQEGCNCLISGGTSSGKTSFLNALIKHVSVNTRILTLEDAREINLPDKSISVQYIVNRNKKNDVVGYSEMIDHLMRSRPDIIMVGEVSLHNAFPILRLLNSGHKGFFCTIHANSSELAIDAAFPQNVQLAGQYSSNISSWLRQTLDVVIHLCSTPMGKKVTNIYYLPTYMDNKNCGDN